MYDYVDGKVDWMAAGLPVEGDDGPFLGGAVEPVPTLAVTGTVADARSVLDGSGAEVVVLVHGDGLAVGAVDDEALDGRAGDDALLEVLRPVPSTVRPSVTVASVAEGGGGSRLVTTSEGRLLGRASIGGSDDHDHSDHSDHDDHGHDHGHDHGDAPLDMEGYEAELAEVMEALKERFGDQEPAPDELRAFLHDRMVAEGKSTDEADRALEELGLGEPG